MKDDRSTEAGAGMSTPEALPCPECGSDSNERDELIKAEREIERLTAERDALKLTVERLQQHNTTTWNAGHTLGVMAGQKALTQAQDALKRDAWGNTQLTEALLAAEAERDALRAALAAAPAPHPDTADAERYRKLVASGKYTAASIGGGWGLACGGARWSKAELDAAADALPAATSAPHPETPEAKRQRELLDLAWAVANAPTHEAQTLANERLVAALDAARAQAQKGE